MSPLLAFLINKGMSIVAGLIIVFLGYRLFEKGVFSNAGELDGKFGKSRILLKKAAPGTFFALMGSCVILLSIYKSSYQLKDLSGNGTSLRMDGNVVVNDDYDKGVKIEIDSAVTIPDGVNNK